MKIYKIRLNLEWNPDPYNHYTVTSPDIPEMFTYGSTLEEIQHNVQDAINCMIDIYTRKGWELPAAIKPEQAKPIEQLNLVAVAA